MLVPLPASCVVHCGRIAPEALRLARRMRGYTARRWKLHQQISDRSLEEIAPWGMKKSVRAPTCRWMLGDPPSCNVFFTGVPPDRVAQRGSTCVMLQACAPPTGGRGTTNETCARTTEPVTIATMDTSVTMTTVGPAYDFLGGICPQTARVSRRRRVRDVLWDWICTLTPRDGDG